MGATSQRTRVLVAVILSTLPVALFAGALLWRELKAAEEAISNDRIALAQAAALTAEALVEGSLDTVRMVAITLPITHEPGSPDLRSYMGAISETRGDWRGMVLIGGDGWPALANPEGRRGTFLGDRAYFQQAMASGDVAVSSALLGRVSRDPNVILAAPVDWPSGERTVLTVPLPTNRMASTLRNQVPGDGSRLIVIDGEGQALVHPDPMLESTAAALRGRPEIEVALNGGRGKIVVQAAGTETLYAFAPVADYGWAVLIGETTATAFAPARSTFNAGVGALGLAVCMVIVIGWYAGGRASAFYERLVEARAESEAARAEAESGHRRAAFLAEASRALDSSLDADKALAALTDLCVPYLADWAAADVLDDYGIPQRLALAHGDPSKADLVSRLLRLGATPSWPGAPRSGRSVLHAEVSPSLLQSMGVSDDERRMLESLGIAGAMVVPLLVHGRPRGALIFVSEVPDRYTSKDLRFAEEVAARAALALDQARLYEEVQRAVMTRDDFLVSASHDLRNPLSAIRVTAQALQLRASRDGLTDSRQLRTALEIIDSAAGRMAGLISGLLDVARLQHGEPLDLAYDSVDLVPLVRQMVTEAQQGSPRHQIQLEADQSMVGSWDPERLQRLLGNLLDNAVKYSPDGGAITITLRLGIERGSEAILTVSDDGVGIPAADLPRVFERFRRGGNVVGRVPGNGIGLAGARQIVEQHGGTISVTSQEGHGTTVTVHLPLSAPGLSTDGSHRGEAETTTDGVVAGAR